MSNDTPCVPIGNESATAVSAAVTAVVLTLDHHRVADFEVSSPDCYFFRAVDVLDVLSVDEEPAAVIAAEPNFCSCL